MLVVLVEVLLLAMVLIITEALETALLLARPKETMGETQMLLVRPPLLLMPQVEVVGQTHQEATLVLRLVVLVVLAKFHP